MSKDTRYRLYFQSTLMGQVGLSHGKPFFEKAREDLESPEQFVRTVAGTHGVDVKEALGRLDELIRPGSRVTIEVVD